jgi:predicted Fe-Mo cluster-binding NifX family protein
MKLLAIPNFGDRISPRIDYAETLQLITVEDKKILHKDTIKIIAHSNLERINQIIRLNPNVVICDGISNLLHDKLIEHKIEIVPWVHGRVDDIVEKYLNGTI